MQNRFAFLFLWITLLKMSLLAKPQFFGKKLPSVSLGGVRFGGGGGGRPGGKPGKHFILFSYLMMSLFHSSLTAFNWKEKKALGIKTVKVNAPRQSYLPRGVHLSGEFDTIAHLVSDLPKGDIVELKPGDKKSEEAIRGLLERIEKDETTRRTQPTLNVASLFGSKKSVGFIKTASKSDTRKRESA